MRKRNTIPMRTTRRTDDEIAALKTKYGLIGENDTLAGFMRALELEAEAKAAEEKQTRLRARKEPKQPPKEHEIQRDIAKALETAGFMVIRINSSTSITEHGTRLSAYRVVNINATSGHADLAVYKAGRVWMLEVKRPSGSRQSDTQKRFEDCCSRYGVPYHIVTSPEQALTIVMREL